MATPQYNPRAGWPPQRSDPESGNPPGPPVAWHHAGRRRDHGEFGGSRRTQTNGRHDS